MAPSEAPSCEDVRPSKRPGDVPKSATIGRHYYPEGGWGWVVLFMATLIHTSNHGLHQAAGILLLDIVDQFGSAAFLPASWLGGMSTAVALLLSPVTMSFCRRKSTRLTAVLGGLVTALGCLFTSFASQFHQLFFSYGTVIGIGVGMTRDSSTLMVGQYFKRKREFVEIFVVSGSGLGITVMSVFIKGAISSIGWRLGLQAVTGVVFLTFLMGTFYRSASLYHPQRRAILHLKNQKRKVKEKNRVEDKPPFFDLTTLRSKTVQILLVSTGLSSFGINTPIIYLAHQAQQEGLEDGSLLLLQTYLGLGWTLGCCAFGFMILQKNTECRIGRQYLCQASVFMCGISILAFTAVKGYHGYVMFAWIYGIFCGGYHYSLKMYTYEKVRARNFARTWGFVQCSQAIPIAIGVPITGYINVGYGDKAGYYFSSTFVIFGSMTIFLIDIHRRNIARHKHVKKDGRRHSCVNDTCPEVNRRNSLTELEIERHPQLSHLAQRSFTFTNLADLRIKPELTCISEEGIADMDIPDHILEELEYLGDCITSCDKVENFLMMSEFENNLIKQDLPSFLDRRGRRRSSSINRANSTTGNGQTLLQQLQQQQQQQQPQQLQQQQQQRENSPPTTTVSATTATTAVTSNSATKTMTSSSSSSPRLGSDRRQGPSSSREIPNFNTHAGLKSGNFRSITVIEEASV
ncbi:monocarboxylate transporter 10-like isoform X2 [Oratosquilla oratoria]|uniref:monocarboxylate transporter 10-like isoform X2 n=1 Tax=Oratosquilla oratoria TaxID=337810 RepID=UPI003F75FDB2